MSARILDFARKSLPIHKRIYTTVMILIVVSQIISPTAWWFFWPLLIWSVLFTLHVMTMRTIDIDDEWIEERSDKVAENAFDFAQMEGIRKHASKRAYGEAYTPEEPKRPPRKK